MASPKRAFISRTRAAATAIWLLALPMVFGCSTVSTVKDQTRKIAEAVTFSGGHLKKVGIAPFENRTFLSDHDFEQMFQRHFTATLAEACGDTIWLRPGDVAYPAELIRLPRQPLSDRLDTLALAKLGRQLGLNAIVIVRAVDVEARERETGFFIFRNTEYIGKVRISTGVYSTETGAKLTDQSFVREMEIDGAEFDAIRARDTDGVYELADALEEMALTAGEKVCTVLSEQPWQGYVISSEDGQLTLSSGRETGLKPGQELTVYQGGEVIKNRYGQEFLISGGKIGEIRITAVLIGKAKAVMITGVEIPPGSIVRPK